MERAGEDNAMGRKRMKSTSMILPLGHSLGKKSQMSMKRMRRITTVSTQSAKKRASEHGGDGRGRGGWRG